MTKEEFIKELSPIFDKAANWTSGNRTFTETEKASFMEQMYGLMTKAWTAPLDFTSPQFFYALKRAEKNFESIQEQCSHLEQYFQEEVAKALASQKKKTP